MAELQQLAPWVESRNDEGMAAGVAALSRAAAAKALGGTPPVWDRGRRQAPFSAVPAVALQVDRRGVLLTYRACAQVAQVVALDSIVGRRVVELLPPAIHDVAASHLEEVFRTGSGWPYVVDVEAFGELRSFECRMVACPDGTALASVREITDRMCAERNSQAEFEELELEVRRVEAFLAEQADALRLANERLEAETAERRRVEVYLRQSLEASQRSRLALLSAMDEQSRAEAAIVSAKERAEASERAQAVLLERLNATQHVASIGSWELDLVTNASWWSDETYRIFGATAQEPAVSLVVCDRYIHPDDLDGYKNRCEREMRSWGGIDQDVRILSGDGQLKWCNVQCRVVHSDAGEPVRLIGTIQDISERKRSDEAQEVLEMRLVQSQRMESVGRLAGGIAHDFNNLLSVILGNVEALLDPVGSATLGDSLEALSEVRDAANRARSLTQQLLAFSRRQVLEIARLDLNAVVADFEKILARLIGEDIALVTRLHALPVEIEADRSQIEQIVLNLAVNARDAMRQGGRLTLSCGTVLMGGTAALSNGSIPPQGEYAELAATDTGCGMSPSVMSHIFEPFFTTKELGQGTGLGLATVYGIVKQHGGHIEVESSEGGGTTFRILLPLAGAAGASGR